MPLDLEPIGHRDFETILAEAKARIPVHVPEWTHFNESDPGITLVQLFAFMAESLLYRANRIPERNRQAFLRLLRIGLQPATPAAGMVVFHPAAEPPTAALVPAGQRLLAGKVEFRTTTAVTALPVDFRVLHKAPASLTEEQRAEWELVFDGFRDTPADELRFYETRQLPVPEKGLPLPRLDVANDTVDRSVWIALLARKPPREGHDTVAEARTEIGGRTLTVGVVPEEDDQGLLPPGGREAWALSPPPEDQEPGEAQWEVFDGMDTSGTVPRARYKPLRVLPGSDDVLAGPGVVHLELPPAERLRAVPLEEPNEEGTGNLPPRIEEDAVRARVVTWIRLHFRSDRPATALHWLGPNAARVRQAVVVTGEAVGVGSGEPDQVVTLAQRPVLDDSLQLTVREADGTWTAWSAVPELFGRRRDEAVYVLDPEAGRIRFGDGLEGRRPPRGQPIRATYEYGGGTAGNVPIGAIAKGVGGLQGLKVHNPLPTRGGAEGETVEEGEERVPRYLRHRDRLVTVDDFRDILDRTPGVRIGRRDVLPTFHPELGPGTPGAVTLLVVPSEDPLQPEAPRPDAFFLRRVCEWLEPRRLVTTEVHVRGPCYVPVWASAVVRTRTGAVRDEVVRAVAEALRRYLSPVSGGLDGMGWPLGKAVLARDLEAWATRVPGVEFVVSFLLAGPHGREVGAVPMEGLELPWLRGIEVLEGPVGTDPVPLAEVVGDTPSEDDAALSVVVPVPVLPEGC